MVTCYPRGGYFCSRGPCLNIQPVPVLPHVQDRPSPTPSPQPAPTPKPAAQASALPQTSAILEAMQAQTNAILESQNNILEAIQLTSQPIPAAQTPVEVQAPAQVQPQLDQLVSAVSKLSSGFETLSATVAQQGKILAQLSSGLTTLSQVVAATTCLRRPVANWASRLGLHHQQVGLHQLLVQHPQQPLLLLQHQLLHQHLQLPLFRLLETQTTGVEGPATLMDYTSVATFNPQTCLPKVGRFAMFGKISSPPNNYVSR